MGTLAFERPGLLFALLALWGGGCQSAAAPEYGLGDPRPPRAVLGPVALPVVARQLHPARFELSAAAPALVAGDPPLSSAALARVTPRPRAPRGPMPAFRRGPTIDLEDLPFDHSLPAPSTVAPWVGIGGAWSLTLSAGADRLEEDVEATDIGLTDTFLSVGWQYGMTPTSGLVWSFGGVRTQDEGLLVAFDDAEFVWGVFGLRIGF